METRANYATIGLFTLGVIVACLVFIYWLARLDDSGVRKPLRVLIPGSVSGLASGSQVLFNGIKIGEVTTLRINPDNPAQVEAMVGVDPSQPIKDDTRASLGVQGLTGLAYIEFRGGTASKPNIIDQPGVQTIIAQGSGLQDILESAQDLIAKVNTAVDRVNGFINTAEPPLTSSVQNIQKFTGALAQNSDGVKDFMQNVGDLSKKLGPLSEQLSSAVGKADKILGAVDTSTVSDTIASINKVSKQLAASSDTFPRVVANVNDVAEQLKTTLASAQQIVQAVEAEKVKSTINSIATVATRVQNATVDINAIVADAGRTVSDAKDFVAGVKAKQPQIDQIVSNTKEISDKLNAAATRVDTILGKAQDILNDPQGRSFFTEATGAAHSIRIIAEQFQGKAGQIADNLSSFTGEGLRNVNGLVDQLRRTTTRLDQTLNSVNSNPQRLIFGNPSVQDYNRK